MKEPKMKQIKMRERNKEDLDDVLNFLLGGKMNEKRYTKLDELQDRVKELQMAQFKHKPRILKPIYVSSDKKEEW